MHLRASYLECRLCGEPERFQNALALEDHLRDSHGDDLLEEDFQATVDASMHWDIDWPELCPVCQLSLVQHQPTSSPLKEHLRKEHRGDVLDEDVEKIVSDQARSSDSCPRCNVTISQPLPLTHLSHMSQCLHEFALRALPWNDHLAPAPKQDVDKDRQIKQWRKISESSRAHDRPGTPPPPGSIDEGNLDKLPELFPEIWMSDHSAKQPDTSWEQDFSTLDNSNVLGSPKVIPLDDDQYFDEENEDSLCPVSGEMLETFGFYLRYVIAVFGLFKHTEISTLLDELENIRASPLTNGQSLQSAFCHLGRSNGPFQRCGESLLLSEVARLQFQRLKHFVAIAYEANPRYVVVLRQ
jgi:hypothetical protein